MRTTPVVPPTAANPFAGIEPSRELAHGWRVVVTVSMQVRLFGTATVKNPRPDATAAPSKPTMRVVEGRRTWTLGTYAPSRAIVAPPTPTDPGAAPIPRLAAGGDHDVLVIPAVIPRKVKWKNNGHRVADELDIDLRLSSLPFPPDGSLVRSILVEMRRRLVTADEWADAMVHGAALFADLDKPADFVGFVDTHKLSFSAGASGVVTLPCRDLAGIFHDTRCGARRIRTDIPVDQAIAEFLSTVPAAGELEVVWAESGTPPTLGALAPKAKTPKSGKGVALKPPRPDRTSILDAISDYCTLAAVMPSWRGYQLWLASAGTFDRDILENVGPRMMFGANLQKLELTHNLTAAHAPPVEVHAFDPDTGRMIVARYPPDSRRKSGEKLPGRTYQETADAPLWVPPGADGVDEKPPVVKVMSGITDKAHLLACAKQVFEETARQELTGSFETSNLATLRGLGQGVADLLDLRAGDPVRLEIAPSIEQASGSFVQRLHSMPRDQAVRTLVGYGYDELVAGRLVDGLLATKRPLTYYAREQVFTWSHDGATEIEGTFANYVDVEEASSAGASTQRQIPNPKLGTSKAASTWAGAEGDMLRGDSSVSDGLEAQAAAFSGAEGE